MLKRYRIDLSYDGSAYAGWQIQPNGITVQGTIERAIAKLTGNPVKIHGSGRTDRGVHARQQVVHTDVIFRGKTHDMHKALNALLPPDIRIISVKKATRDFHARRSAVEKEYRYFIWNARILPPFLRNYRTHIQQSLDVKAMKEAADSLLGNNDFASFTANPNRVVESTVRTLSLLDVRKKGSEIVIIARSEGFLYKMVRSLAGFLIRVGEGAEPPSGALGILNSRLRTARVPTAPPQGLFLWKIFY